jgi:hypothetical protein
VERLLGVPWNPPIRIDESSNPFQLLKEKISLMGQIQIAVACPEPSDWMYDPLPRGALVLLDGIRRRAAIDAINRDLPREDRMPMLCVVRQWDMQKMLIAYHILNNTQLKHNVNQLMSAWLRNEHAVPPERASEFTGIVKHIGRAAFVRMEKAAKSIQTYKFAVGLCNRGEKDAISETVVMLIDWMIRRGTTGVVRSALGVRGFEQRLIDAAAADMDVEFNELGKLIVKKPGDEPKKLKIAK